MEFALASLSFVIDESPTYSVISLLIGVASRDLMGVVLAFSIYSYAKLTVSKQLILVSLMWSSRSTFKYLVDNLVTLMPVKLRTSSLVSS